MVISPALDRLVGGDAGGSLKSLIDANKRRSGRRSGHVRGAVISGHFAVNGNAADEPEGRYLW